MLVVVAVVVLVVPVRCRPGAQKSARGRAIEGLDLVVRVAMGPKCVRGHNTEGLDLVGRAGRG